LFATENNVLNLRRAIGHSCPLARGWRLLGQQLLPGKAASFPCWYGNPFPCRVLIYPATSATKKNNCFQAWIESSATRVNPLRLSTGKLQRPIFAIICPGVHWIDVSQTTK